jgi:hypothetical protein
VTLGAERDAQPGTLVRHDPQRGDLGAPDKLLVLGIRAEEERLAQAQRITGQAGRIALADRLPCRRVGDVLVDAVDVVGEVQQAPRLVIEGDVEVLRVHQLADDGVHGRVELGQVVDGAGDVGDAVERGLHVGGALGLGLIGLQLRDTGAQRRQLVGRWTGRRLARHRVRW